MRHGEQHCPETAPKESSQWFDILAFPQTLDGFRLDLRKNGPRTIKPRHQRRLGQLVDQTLREKTGTPGFHNPIKVNLHPLPLDPANPDVLSYNTTPTQYVDFYTLSDRKHIPKSLQEQVRSSGVQVVWRTTEPDGSHKFVFEVRSEHAGLYPSFGGTIGGGIDGTLAFAGGLDNRAVLQDGSPKKIIDHAVLEAEEELGIGTVLGNMMRQSYDIRDGNLIVMGIGKDKKRNYYDVLCRGLLPVGQATLQGMYERHKASGNDKLSDPMPTRLIFMDDRPDVYQQLLASLMPLTPMTQASLLLAGYMSRMEEVLSQTEIQKESIRKANDWRQQTESLMHKKDTDMDKRAKEMRRKLSREEWRAARKAFAHVIIRGTKSNFYTFEQAFQNAWNGARKRPRGLSTKLTPQDQGLPKTEITLEELQKS